MPTLPVQGGNNNTWGTDLNAWLSSIVGTSIKYTSTVLGNGSTSDTAAINTLIASGGTFEFPPGTYIIGSPGILIAASHTHLRGHGAILKLASGANCSVINVNLSGTPIQDISIQGFEIDGNSVAQTLRIPNATVHAGTTNMGGISSADVYNMLISENYVHDTLNTGIGHTRSTGIKVFENWVARCGCIRNFQDIGSNANESCNSIDEIGTPAGLPGIGFQVVNNRVSEIADVGIGAEGNGLAGCTLGNNVIHDLLAPVTMPGIAIASCAGTNPPVITVTGTHNIWAGQAITISGCNVAGLNTKFAAHTVSSQAITLYQTNNTTPANIAGATGATSGSLAWSNGGGAGWTIGGEVEPADAANNQVLAITGNIAMNCAAGVVLATTGTLGKYFADVAVTGNSIFNMSGPGMAVEGQNLTVVGNTIIGCASGITSTLGGGTQTHKNWVISNNSISLTPGVDTFLGAGIGIRAIGTSSVGTTSTITHVGAVATFTVANVLVPGQWVTVTGATPADYNGTWQVATASASVFTAVLTSTPASSASVQGAVSVAESIESLEITGNIAVGAGAFGTGVGATAHQNSSGIYLQGLLRNVNIAENIASQGYFGLMLDAVNGSVTVSGGQYHHNNDAGISLAGAIQPIVQGVFCHDNGVNPQFRVAGISVGTVDKATLRDCTCYNSAYLAGGTGANGGTSDQTIGITIDATATNTRIEGGDVTGNGLGGTLSTTTLKSVHALAGYNDTLVSTALTPTTGAYTNISFRDATYTVLAGTVSSITIGGVATGKTSGDFLVPAGQAFVVNNTVIPTTFRQILM